MSQGIASLHKILKDETRQKIITLLNEKGSLSYSDLMEELDVLSTGLLNYHLKVLGNLLQKNENGHYMLSEKGNLAYRCLTTDFPEEHALRDKRIFKAWIVFTIASIIIAILYGNFQNIPIERTAKVIFILLLSTGFAFYIRVKPSNSGNRVFFIAVGAFGIGFIFWFLLTSLIMFSGLRSLIIGSTGSFGDDFVVTTNLVISWIVGGWVGDLIGKGRNYIIPMLRV
jgi:DNA-binding transcriptional ArsR family regulator